MELNLTVNVSKPVPVFYPGLAYEELPVQKRWGEE